jgi:hypothetical protein
MFSVLDRNSQYWKLWGLDMSSLYWPRNFGTAMPGRFCKNVGGYKMAQPALRGYNPVSAETSSLVSLASHRVCVGAPSLNRVLPFGSEACFAAFALRVCFSSVSGYDASLGLESEGQRRQRTQVQLLELRRAHGAREFSEGHMRLREVRRNSEEEGLPLDVHTL